MVGKRWNSKEVCKLHKLYFSKSLEDLADTFERSEGSVAQKLLNLSRVEPSKWDDKCVRLLVGQFQILYRGGRPKEYNPNLKWSKADVSALQDNYMKSSILVLAARLKRGPWGLIQKLRRLNIESQKDWYDNRIKELYTEIHRLYRHKMIPLKPMTKKTRPSLYKAMYHRKVYTNHIPAGLTPEEKKEYKIVCKVQLKLDLLNKTNTSWTDRDINILCNTYIMHSWNELQQIFQYKKPKVHVKLRQLYLMENAAWDLERIEQIEYGYGQSRRKVHIDNLIEEGLNAQGIADKLNMSRQAIYNYINSRYLKQHYRQIRKGKTSG